ncbi:uncharacterized protein CCOS01_10684, partial [Colletotrichum costaricense]
GAAEISRFHAATETSKDWGDRTAPRPGKRTPLVDDHWITQEKLLTESSKKACSVRSVESRRSDISYEGWLGGHRACVFPSNAMGMGSWIRVTLACLHRHSVVKVPIILLPFSAAETICSVTLAGSTWPSKPPKKDTND